MKETLKVLNEKSDNRFVYAIGLFVLLSICVGRFPSEKTITTIPNETNMATINLETTAVASYQNS